MWFIMITAIIAVAGEVSSGSLGAGAGTIVGTPEPVCGTLLFHSDGTYENGYCWQYGGVVDPDYGALAEGYEGVFEVCAAVFDLTTLTDPFRGMDVYLWADDGGSPGLVHCLEVGADPGAIAMWPNVSRHPIEFADPRCTEEGWWIGYWGAWPDEPCHWFVGADLDGPGGSPMTKIGPGQGYPSGWQDVSIVWGPTQALGIGAEVQPCDPTPTRQTTWGGVKGLYRKP